MQWNGHCGRNSETKGPVRTGFSGKVPGRSWSLRWAGPCRRGRTCWGSGNWRSVPRVGRDQQQGNHHCSKEHSMFKETGRRAARCAASALGDKALPFLRMWSLSLEQSPNKGWLTSPFTPHLGDKSLLQVLLALHRTHAQWSLRLPWAYSAVRPRPKASALL